MKSRKSHRVWKGLALVAGLVGAAGLPAACGSDDNKGKGGSGNGGNGGNAGDASSGGGSGGLIITTGGSNGTGNSSGSGGLGVDGCAVSNVAAATKPVNVLLVVDRSGSMLSDPFNDAGTPTKW